MALGQRRQAWAGFRQLFRKRIFLVWLAVNATSLAVSAQGTNGWPGDASDLSAASASNRVVETPTGGFRRGVEDAGVAVGACFVAHNGRDKCSHNLEFFRIYYGWMLGSEMATNHWWRGNCEVVEEVFTGAQSHPTLCYAVGETTVLRYNFATGTRWSPFFEAGFGVMATDIGHPNLGSVFEFNEHVGVGLNYFWRHNRALNVQYRLLHISNGGIATPNGGLVGHELYVGVTWYF